MMVKLNKFNFLWVYLASINLSCVNNPSVACKVVETLYLQCKLTLVNSTPSICTHTRPNCDKNCVCLANILPETIEFYTGKPVVPVTNSMSGPQSSTQCHQSFPCCTVCLVRLALRAREIPYGGGGGSSHADTHLLSDCGDTCSTSATWLYRQQDLEGKNDLINQSVTRLFV